MYFLYEVWGFGRTEGYGPMSCMIHYLRGEGTLCGEVSLQFSKEGVVHDSIDPAYYRMDTYPFPAGIDVVLCKECENHPSMALRDLAETDITGEPPKQIMYVPMDTTLIPCKFFTTDELTVEAVDVEEFEKLVDHALTDIQDELEEL